ncbi:hypothetical protein [Streptomyces sp. NBC_01092]|uniref:hypothetical protein n=1 Tax=Streptomyces sp. NBC_01092 TaxID=2903748 RepID=UPI00386CA6E1|nr:hypothetical protein OG254_48760 [Streptomyces sp. NBC_01092]
MLQERRAAGLPAGECAQLAAQWGHFAVQCVECAQCRPRGLVGSGRQAVSGNRPGPLVIAEQVSGWCRDAVVEEGAMDALHPGGVLIA